LTTLKRKNSKWILALITILFSSACVLVAFTVLGSSLTLWLALDQFNVTATPTATPRKIAALADASSPTPSPTSTITPLPTTTPTSPPTATPTLVPTWTPSATSTPRPPTLAPAPPSATPIPTDTPTPEPSFPFIILETAAFPTNHLNFDIYVAITNEDNKPLSGYRVLGHHSSGLQIDSQTSANDWTVNSGARHYKGGNLKYEAPNSPSGVWTMQLVDEAGQPVASPIDFPFDAASPSWYFILYRQVD
jgi:hypothetical protein